MSEPQKQRVSSGADCPDSRVRTRRAALDVLTLLRELEENVRVALSDDAYDAGSDHSSQGCVVSPMDATFSVSVVRFSVRCDSILVRDEERKESDCSGSGGTSGSC
jgi:hypothetical protein